MSETAREQEWTLALCPLCEAPLYLEWHTSQGLFVESAGLTPRDAHTTAWSVVCEEGHTVAVSRGTPEDETADYAAPFTMDQIPRGVSGE